MYAYQCIYLADVYLSQLMIDYVYGLCENTPYLGRFYVCISSANYSSQLSLPAAGLLEPQLSKRFCNEDRSPSPVCVPAAGLWLR